MREIFVENCQFPIYLLASYEINNFQRISHTHNREDADYRRLKLMCLFVKCYLLSANEDVMSVKTLILGDERRLRRFSVIQWAYRSSNYSAREVQWRLAT